MQLQGAVALVTGASSGLGTAAAESLAARGATVLAHGRDAAALERVAARTGGVALAADLTVPGAAADLAERALAVHGRVDVLVANAGAGFAGDLSTMDAELIDALVAVNLTASLRLARALLPPMLDRGRGAVVFVTSIAGRTGVAGEAVYAATKAGLDAFAESVRFEVRGRGVSVGVCVPGVIATPFFDRRGRPYARSFPRPQPPRTVAAAIVGLVESGAAEAYRPRWLRLPVAVRGGAPGPYRWLATRFGGS